MRYVSTRGTAPVLSFEEAVLAGLARDGGLYVPEAWPRFSAEEIRSWRGLSYPDLAATVMRPFVGEALGEEELHGLTREAYSSFDHVAVAPLKQIGANDWVMELFHGPTLAFKDFALQFLGRLFDLLLTRRGERLTIVGATSGDTGSAAIEACRDRAALDIFILHPHGRVSEVQRRQMTGVHAPNVFNIAIEGNFDDCQNLVKALFADEAFRDSLRLSAVNSINWARVMAQIVYYYHAALALGGPDRRLAFAVPTGNFGNVYAGYAARASGLPIERFLIGCNANDILARFFEANDMSVRPVTPTSSPSMDIQISSNFERLLFEMYGRDGSEIARLMGAFKTEGRLPVDSTHWQDSRDLFDAWRLDDAETAATIADIKRRTGALTDPHSAIGIAAARARRPDAAIPTVALATAHPAKFPDAVAQATGERAPLPRRLVDLFEREEHYTVLPNDLAAVQEHIRARAQILAG